MTAKQKFILSLLLSLLAGAMILYMDSRPGWDDTGITAGVIVVTSALFGFLLPARPWIWALTVSGWIPLYAIVLSGDFKMLLVSVFGFAGAGPAARTSTKCPKGRSS